MKVYLHIGMSKAGSTAIQRCLTSRQEALRDAGVCYPVAGRIRNAHYALFLDLRDGRGAGAVPDMLAEAEGAGASTMVVSVEGLWFLPDDAVAQLADALAGHDARVVLYLRRPDAYLTSSYRQRIKKKRGTASVQAFVAEPIARLRYDHVLARWARHFPLRVRAYEAVRSDLVGDFAEATGTRAVLDCSPGRRLNVTPSDGALRLMLWANRIVASDKVGRTVNRRLLAWQRAFGWMPPLNDAPLVARARAEAERWDRAVMARHLAPEDLAAITPPAG